MIEIIVNGMICIFCVIYVKDVLEKIFGVNVVVVFYLESCV